MLTLLLIFVSYTHTYTQAHVCAHTHTMSYPVLLQIQKQTNKQKTEEVTVEKAGLLSLECRYHITDIELPLPYSIKYILETLVL